MLRRQSTLKRKHKAAQLRLAELVFDFLFEVNKLCLDLWVYVAWFLQWTAGETNDIARAGPLLLLRQTAGL